MDKQGKGGGWFWILLIIIIVIAIFILSGAKFFVGGDGVPAGFGL